MDSTILSTASRAIRRVWRHAWATGATRVESAAVLRLVAASITAGVPVAPILDAWAEDSRGGQGTRLERAARLLRRGATASEAVTRVPGLVQEDHAVALAFGERLGIVGPVVRAALAGDELLDATARRELRGAIGYLVVVVAVLVLMSTFLAVKILPQFTKLLDDMQSALFQRALAFRQSNMTKVDAWSDFEAVFADQGSKFVLAHWDGTTETELAIKEATKATIRCIPLPDEGLDDGPGKCVKTGKPSAQRVLFAKNY